MLSFLANTITFLVILALSTLDAGVLKGEQASEIENKYLMHLAALASDLNAGTSEIDFWKRLSGNYEVDISVWSVVGRTFGRGVTENSFVEIVPPASLLLDGDGCTVLQVREISDHVIHRKQLRACIRVRKRSGKIVDYECTLDSYFKNDLWISKYWTVSLSEPIISHSGEFHENRSKLSGED